MGRRLGALLVCASMGVAGLAACGGDDGGGASSTTTAQSNGSTTSAGGTSGTTGAGGSASSTTTGAGGGSTTEVTLDASAPAIPAALPDGMGSGEPDGTYPRTVTHFLGEAVIPAEPKRVVVIATGQLDSTLTLGVVPVGSTAAQKAEMVPGYLAAEFPQYADGLAAMTELGTRTEPNLEAVAAARPDLIFMNSTNPDLYPLLSSVAPTVVTEGQGFPWKQDFLLMADALGRLGQAEDILDDIAAAAADIGREHTDAPPTVSLVRFTGDRTRVFGYRSFAGSIAIDAGLLRPESQQFVDPSPSMDISLEQIEMIDADWLFYSVLGKPEDTPFAQFSANPLWAELQAVKDSRAIQVEDEVWYLNTGPTTARVLIEQMSEHL